jgi:hypothetical protein
MTITTLPPINLVYRNSDYQQRTRESDRDYLQRLLDTAHRIPVQLVNIQHNADNTVSFVLQSEEWNAPLAFRLTPEEWLELQARVRNAPRKIRK